MAFSAFIAVLITLVVSFVNGMTDAPNAIVSCVSTGTVSLKKAVVIASVSDFAGSLIFGVFNRRVAQTVIDIASIDAGGEKALTALSAAMLCVVLWAVSAWFFGIPTSESHALIAAVAGAGVSLNGSFGSVNINAWSKIFEGLFVSVVAGFAAGYFITKLTSVFFVNERTNRFYGKCQVVSGALMSFMHGAQDSQKFTGIVLLALSVSEIKKYTEDTWWIYILCPFFIAAGTATGGERIIKTVGSNMIKMNNAQGFSSDIAGTLCLLISTLMGMPVSTTHTKISAVMGSGVAYDIKSLDKKIAGEMVSAWLITFPCCAFLGWMLTKIAFYFAV
ncbi:MAG: inorganic phosphate transporter [Clostridia bacterium]|nr:inorganic phosphate transporter [Clostridia bacterium]